MPRAKHKEPCQAHKMCTSTDCGHAHNCMSHFEGQRVHSRYRPDTASTYVEGPFMKDGQLTSLHWFTCADYIRAFDEARIKALRVPKPMEEMLLNPNIWNAAIEAHEDVVQALEIHPTYIILLCDPEDGRFHQGFETLDQVENYIRELWESRSPLRPTMIMQWCANNRYKICHWQWRFEWS